MISPIKLTLDDRSFNTKEASIKFNNCIFFFWKKALIREVFKGEG